MNKFIIFCTVLFLVSCKKEEENCNCGRITNDGVDIATNCYWIEIENDCSGNRKTFCIDQDKWWDANAGEDFCITNVSSW